MELKNSEGKVESNLEKVCDTYHLAIEKKTEKIAEEMAAFDESEDEEKEAIRTAGIHPGRTEFKFKELTSEEVRKVINNLPRKTSCGVDQILYIEIKDGEFFVTPLLTNIINLTLKTSHWPKSWSNSIIKPLYKGEGELNDPYSYRPVALTCALSRVAEKILAHQLSSHLED